MPIITYPSNRHHVVVPLSSFSIQEAQKDLLTLEHAETDFCTLGTPMAAAQQTLFKVYADGDDIVIVICLIDMGDRTIPEGTSIEIFLDPFHDHNTYFQYVFTYLAEKQEVQVVHHLPMREAASTAFQVAPVKEFSWQTADTGGPAGVYDMTFPGWLIVRFAAADVFRSEDAVGFNISRFHPDPKEYSSWNPATGYGLQDATSFGHLYQETDLCALSGTQVWCIDQQLYLAGELSHEGQILDMELIDSVGERLPIQVESDGAVWQVNANIENPRRGRYRLMPRLEDEVMEPEFFAFEPFPELASTTCRVGMTYDLPDNFLCSPQPYTSEALAAEFDQLLHLGIRRLHWIDYGPGHTVWPRLGKKHFQKFRQSHARCGDLLPLAASLANERGMELIAIFKPFDLAINYSFYEGEAVPGFQTVQDLEGRDLLLPDDWPRHATMQPNAEWLKPPTYPVTRLRLYSTEPIGEDAAKQVTLLASADNQAYTAIDKVPTVGEEERPNISWTPAGNQPDDDGSHHTWYLEWTDISVDESFVAFQISGDELTLVNRAHALVEAWDADGLLISPLPANQGSRDDGFSFWKDWASWANHSSRVLTTLTCGEGAHGVSFEWPRELPTVLEPTHPDARACWLAELTRIVDSGVHGVSIRTLCHHNNVSDFLTYAFSPAVIEEFQQRHNRAPRAETGDYDRIRRLRGDMYMRFLADASEIIRDSGSKFILHIESGMELPPTGRQRMEMHLDWEQWLRKGYMDEIILKGWFPHNRYVQDQILPVARQLDVPVYICDRNHSLLNTTRSVDAVTAKVSDARASGCNGFVFYESADYLKRGATNRASFVDEVRLAMQRAYPASLL